MVLMILAAASPNYADGPVQTVVHYDGWYSKGPCPEGPCPFTITIHATGVFHNKKWYDENQNLVQEMYVYGGNKYYLFANDKRATVLNSGKLSISYISPEEALVTLDGQEWSWIIPGYGMLSGEVGKQTWLEAYDENGVLVDVIVQKLVGNIMWTDVTPVLCDHLGP
jgi:hypothetical protein